MTSSTRNTAPRSWLHTPSKLRYSRRQTAAAKDANQTTAKAIARKRAVAGRSSVSSMRCSRGCDKPKSRANFFMRDASGNSKTRRGFGTSGDGRKIERELSERAPRRERCLFPAGAPRAQPPRGSFRRPCELVTRFASRRTQKQTVRQALERSDRHRSQVKLMDKAALQDAFLQLARRDERHL